MKKIFALALVAMMGLTANAQGYVGGSLGFASESYDGNSETVWSIMPEIGYNLNEDWAVGLVVGYGEGKDKTKVDGRTYTDKVKTFAISPYVRYTPVKLDKVNIFIDGGFGYQNIKWGDVKDNIWQFGLTRTRSLRVMTRALSLSASTLAAKLASVCTTTSNSDNEFKIYIMRFPSGRRIFLF